MSFSLKWKQKRYDERKHYIASVKIASGCKDCGIWGPDEILTFDHVKDEKLFEIGQRWDVGQSALEAEIAKCEVVCHNCHAKRTIARLRSPGLPPFVPFPKIPRLSRPIIITEKIDGTNAQVWVDGDGDVWAGSKNRWLTLEQDNYGFAKWVSEHEEEFRNTGPGLYSGEWWGSGINRGYGLKNGERYFSLFNVSKWGDELVRPECCKVVPVLAEWDRFDTSAVDEALSDLFNNGSRAAPGFMNPEGVVIFHTHGNLLFKKTLKNDEAKGKS